jgi:hypothetical protein
VTSDAQSVPFPARMNPEFEIMHGTHGPACFLIFILLFLLWTFMSCGIFASKYFKYGTVVQTGRDQLHKNCGLNTNSDSPRPLHLILVQLYEISSRWLLVCISLNTRYIVSRRGDYHRRTGYVKPDQMRLMRNILRASNEAERDLAELRSLLGSLRVPVAVTSIEPSEIAIKA